MKSRSILPPFLAESSAAALALVLSTGLLGCAEAAFSMHAEDNDLNSLKATLGKIGPGPAGPQNGSGHAMAYVFAGPERQHFGKDKDKEPTGERTLYGYDLTQGKLAFEMPADVRSRFAVGQNILVHRDGESTIVIRDPRTGQVRSRAPLEAGQTLIGLTADAERAYMVTQGTDHGQRVSLVTAIAPDGQRVWRVEAVGSVGAPAARGGVLALPWRYQDVVLLDGRTGTELSRIRQKDEQIGFVRATPEGFFYGVGDKGVALLNERSVTGQKDQIAYFTPTLGDKVRVFLHWDGYRAEQADFSAFDRNRLLWTGAPKGQDFALKDDLFILHSYRFFFAMDQGRQPALPGQSGKIRWAYAQPRQNVMASDETGAAVVFVAQDGELGALDLMTGKRTFNQRLSLKPGQQVLGATFDAAGFAPTAPSGGEQAAPDVLSVLHGIIFDKDSSFIAVKTFAVQAVNTIKTKEATAELLRVVTADAMPGQVARAAGEALVARRDRDVATMLVAALKRRYDYLEDRRPRGVDILARAAAAMGTTEALPALADQLHDSSVPPVALKEVIKALIKLGGKDAVRPLRELILLYRSDPSFAADSEPLRLAGEGLLKLGGEAERRTVYFVSVEPRTIAPVASYYRKILDETAIKLSTKTQAAEKSPEAAPARR